MNALIGPSGCGKSTFLRTLNRMHELSDGGWITGKVLLDGEDVYAAEGEPDAAAPPGRDGVPEADSVSHDVDLRQRGGRAPAERRRFEERAGRDRGALAESGGAVGRGEGPAQGQRHGAVGRPAAAALHRADHRARGRRCCCSTSRPPHSIRLGPSGSRSWCSSSSRSSRS